MNTTPHPPSTACARRGCKAPDCARAIFRYRKQLENDIAHGRRRLRDATQTRAHAHRLLANGWTRTQIATAAGVSIATVSDIASGRPQISVRTAIAVLAIRIGPPPAVRHVAPVGAKRRIQALAYIGYTQPQIASHTGLSRAALAHIIAGTADRILIGTADAIDRTYRQLRWTPGPSSGAMHYARRRGWHGPLAWDDIDDPNAQPDVSDEPDVEVTEKRPEVEHLARFGIPEAEIEARTGACHSYVKAVISQLYTGRTIRRTKPVADQAPLDLGNAQHGRSGYTLGCRCRTCRNGAAEAMRERRNRVKEAA